MANFNTISCEKLARLIGTPKAPVIIDVRTPEDFAENPFLLPASLRRDYSDVADWAGSFRGRWVVVVCQKGRKLSEGVAAFLRLAGAEAENLEDGFEGWRDLGLPLLPAEKLPPRNTNGATLWVTRTRPKIDRIACPWLIRRFVDPVAAFLFVAAPEVEAVAERFGATPFDVDGVFWSHRGELCSFDVMVEEFGLSLPALGQMARIVRGADTDRLDLEPQAAGLLAISLGLSRMYASDLEQLDQGMLIYDALYRWARDAMDEKHDWVVRGGKG